LFTTLSPIAGWLVICDEFIWWIFVSVHSVFQNMLLLTILLNVWHNSKWSLRSLLLVSCKVFFHYYFIMVPIPHQIFSQLHHMCLVM
jgi:hypothetical protein